MTPSEKKTIEAEADKRFPDSQFSDSDTYNRKLFISGAQFGLEMKDGMRWIKASEREPITAGLYYCRLYHNGHVIMKKVVLYDDNDFQQPEYEKDDIEWLDESGEMKDDWVSVEDGTPKAELVVLVLHEKDEFNYHSLAYVDEYGRWYKGITQLHTITHWMYLPEPPKSKTP